MRGTAVPALVSFLVAAITFGICLRNDFVYDDVMLLQMDQRLTDPSQWGRYWTESYNGGVDNLYRPAVSMSYALQWWLHGHTPWPWFLVNVLLHASCAAAVAVYAGRVLASSPERQTGAFAMLAGVLFAVHPVHSEVVASVVGRCESMCALPGLVALTLLGTRVTTTKAIAIWFLATLSLLSKEQGMLLPMLFLAQAWILGCAGDRRAKLTLILLIAWTWAGYLLVRENLIGLKFFWDRGFVDWTQQPLVRSDALSRCLWPIAILGRYVQLLVAPWRLSLDYGYAVTAPKIEPSNPYIHLGALCIAVSAVVAATAWRRRGALGPPDNIATPIASARARLTLFLVVAFLITYAPIANALTLIGTIFGERLIYLPSVFFILLAAVGLSRLGRPGVVLAMVLCVAGVVRTTTYIATFDDRLDFYLTSVANQPASVKLRILLASEYTNRKDYARAATAAAELRQLAPDYTESWYQSAFIEVERRNLDLAGQYLRRSMAIEPTNKAAGLSDVIAGLRAATQPATQPR